MSGIYVHIPFCKAKCIYCDFYSIASTKLIPEYCNAVKKEIFHRRNQLSDQNINTIYFGGGTPSNLKVGEIAEILDCIAKNYKISDNPEITLEANPENLDDQYLKQIRQLGFNRLSVGIQSFENETLSFLRRRHTAEQAIETIISAKENGFDNISIDLIYGISGLSNQTWENTLNKAVNLPITHISCYCLSIEEKTLLHRLLKENKYQPTSDEICRQQFLMFDEILKSHNFEHYEISNACKKGFHSRHNSSYWDRTEYLGFGPAAHSLYKNCRSWNIEDVKRYCEAIEKGDFGAITSIEQLTNEDIFEETIMLGLRTSQGINLKEIGAKFGKAKQEKIETEISKLPRNAYNFDGNKLSLTAEGMFISNSIIVELI
ncbi:MAG: radical SAM family heme chaperone HemW [Bacteroidales bacterium]|nr:radical SAM family heme chaperone HemW [Bacteroidales bacterium]